MRRVMRALCAALMRATPALARSPQKREALSVVGQVFAAKTLCDLIDFEVMALGTIYALYDIDLERRDEKSIVYAKVDETRKAWRGREKEEVCIGAMLLYGPNGENIPGLIYMR